MAAPGESLHRIWREHFKHRWGGNAPSWRHITPAERDLWATVEKQFITERKIK